MLDGLAIGLILGLLSGGRWSNLAHFDGRHVHWIPILFFAQRLVATLGKSIGAPDSVVVWVWSLTSLSMIVVLMMQPRDISIVLIIVGVAANVLVVVANGGMPVYAEAVVPLGGNSSQALGALESSGLHVELTVATRFWVLADIIGIPGPEWHRGIVSLGDVLMSGGAGAVLFRISRHRRTNSLSHVSLD